MLLESALPSPPSTAPAVAWGAALRIVWGLITLLMLTALALPWVASDAAILARTPRCAAQVRDHAPCALCGMTRAFLALSRGQVRQAQHLNPYSSGLYAGFVVACLAFGWRVGARGLRR